jgi:hypothetical protein
LGAEQRGMLKRSLMVTVHGPVKAPTPYLFNHSAKRNVNIDYCLDHNHTECRYKFWNSKYSYTQCRLCTKLKFTKYEKTIHYLGFEVFTAVVMKSTVKPLFIVFVGGSEKETMDPGKQLMREP